MDIDHLSTQILRKRLRALEGLYLELLEFLDFEDRQEYLNTYHAIWQDYYNRFNED